MVSEVFLTMDIVLKIRKCCGKCTRRFLAIHLFIIQTLRSNILTYHEMPAPGARAVPPPPLFGKGRAEAEGKPTGWVVLRSGKGFSEAALPASVGGVSGEVFKACLLAP